MSSDWLQNLSPTFLRCRTIGHTWLDRDGTVMRIGDFLGELSGCPNCGTERLFLINEEGKTVKRDYTYPEGYMRPSDAPPASRREMNLVRLARKKIVEPPREWKAIADHFKQKANT